MTLDEAINHAEEVADKNEKQANWFWAKEDNSIYEDCIKCAEELRQLSDWLKELKRLKEQESCEDTINRKQAKEAIRDRFKDLPSRVEINTILNELPSVTPSYNSIKTELKSCEDCISRQEAIAININHHGQMPNHINHEIWKEINSLPSVAPQSKTGHWILADEQNKEDVENDNCRFICSECQCSDVHAKGTIVPYCWKCGAKMKESEL